MDSGFSIADGLKACDYWSKGKTRIHRSLLTLHYCSILPFYLSKIKPSSLLSPLTKMFAKVTNFFSTKRGLLSLFKVHNTRSAASSHFHCSLVSQNPKLFSTSMGSSASAGANTTPLAAAAANTKRETENSFDHVLVTAAAVLIIGNASWAFVHWKKRVMEELNLMDERSMAIGLLINFSKFRELVFEKIKEDRERSAMVMERVKNLEDELKKLAGGGGDASGSGSGSGGVV